MKRYPEDVRKFIADNVKGTTTKDLVRMTNIRFNTSFTESSMQSYKKNHNLKSETIGGNPTGYSKLFSKEVKDYIFENNKNISAKELTNLVNKIFNTEYKESQIKAFRARHKLDSGLTGRFEKGNIPYTKGKKKFWVGGEETRFKKGNIPKNHRPVGSERINIYGYVEVKIAEPNKWRLKQQIEYEKINGPIPEGSKILFADKDKLNFSPENLICVSNEKLLVMNRHNLTQEDIECTKTGLLIADIYIKAASLKSK